MKRILIVLLIVSLVFSAAACTAQAGDDDKAHGIIYFDADSLGWQNASGILFCITDLDEGKIVPSDHVMLSGKKGFNSIWSFDTSGLEMQVSHVYTIIFCNADTHDQTYPLLLDTTCFGDLAYANHSVLEDPSDCEKALYEVRWKNNSMGPMLKITSLGNVVGETVPANTTPYRMLVDFLASKGKGGLTFALQNNGKTAQKTIDDVAGALNLTKEDVSKAIEEAKTLSDSVTGEKTDWSQLWDARKAKMLKRSDESSRSGSSAAQ